MSLLSLFLLWLHLTLSQEQWRLVHHDGSVEAVFGTPALTAQQRADLVSAWVWNRESPPRRVEPARIGQEHAVPAAGRLAVRVTRRAGSLPPADLRLVAAPREMWGAADEPSLPSWPVPKDGLLSIPWDPSLPWQLRVVGRGEGSWWVPVPPGRRAVYLLSAPATDAEVTVLGLDGKPARPVNAFVQPPPGRGRTVSAWTRLHGGIGRLALPGLPDQAEVVLQILSEGSPPFQVRGRPSALPREVRLPPGAELRGRLLDGGGGPVAGAAVTVEAFAAEDLPMLVEFKAKSGADGRFRLPGLPPGKIAWRAEAPSFVPLSETEEVQPGEHLDVGSRTLEPGTALTLQVVDDTGAPVPDARVRGVATRIEATAGPDGVARLSGLPASGLELRATAPRHLEGALRLQSPLPPRQTPATLLLPRAFTLTGRFVDASGAAVSPGSARFDSSSCQREARLEGDGRFEFDLPPAGPTGTLRLRSPQSRELQVQVPPGRSGEVRDLGDLAADSGLTVTGRVVREDDGSPIPGARIWTTRQGPDGPAVAWAVGDLLVTTAGEDGRFQLAGFLPAPATLRIEAAGLARAQLPLALAEPEPGAAKTVDLGTIPLSAGTTLKVRVDSQSRDLAGAVARADLGNRWLEPDLLTAEVWNGEATLPNVPAGRVLVTVLSGRRLLCEQAVEVGSGGGEQEVDCRRPSLTVTGQVLLGGAPAGPGRLVWQIPSEVPARIDTVVSPGGLRQQSIAGAGRPQVDVPVGPDGRFVTRELVPGHWQVTWISQGTVSPSLAVEVPDRERFDTVLPWSGLALTGTVVDREGRPAEGARVRELETGTLALTRADGSFSLTGLKAGRAAVQAQSEEQASPVAEVELGEQPVPPLHLQLGERKATTITIQVLDAAGAPAASAFVFLHEDGKGQRLLTTAADGKATVALEPPLAPRLRAAAFVRGAWGFGAWTSRQTVSEGEGEGLTVQLAGSPGSLLVQSPHRQGSPAIQTAQGWDLAWLLRLLGAPPRLAAGRPLELSGLPAGLYTVSLDGASVTVTVAEGKVGEGRIE